MRKCDRSTQSTKDLALAAIRHFGVLFLDPFPKKGADSRLTRFTFVSLSFMLLVISAQAQPPAQTEEWKQLFNGKELTGWKHVGPGQMTVGDGLIRTHGGNGTALLDGRQAGQLRDPRGIQNA